MEPIIQAVSEDVKAFAEVIKLDASTEMEIVQELGVSGLPTFIVFKGGKMIKSSVGATSKMNLLKLISEASQV
jgi:thioredoxin 1